MKLNGTMYGTPITGTTLIQHGYAPRRRPADPNRMVWYECACCGVFKAIRLQSVTGGATVSCGRKCCRQSITNDIQLMDNLSTATLRLTPELDNRTRQERRSIIYHLVDKLKLPRCVINFLIATKCATLRALGGAGKAAVDALQCLACFSVCHYLSEGRLLSRP